MTSPHALTYECDVFGAVSAHSGSSASPWKFTGEQHEVATGDTGYYFLRARYYDVDLGRFISRDPVEFDPGRCCRASMSWG